MTAKQVKQMVENAIIVEEDLPNPHGRALLSDYVSNEDGLFFRGQRVCSFLNILARTCDENHQNWGRVIRFRDPDGHLHQHAISMEYFKGDGTELIGRLLSWGLIISPTKRLKQKLLEYIQMAQFSQSSICVARVGWYNNCFVLPESTIPVTEGIYLQNDRSHTQGFQVSGSLEDWQEHVAKLCRGNSRLILALSCAFAAPLFPLVNAESGGFNLKGSSSIGKSTALTISASVWGSLQYIQQWRTTGNALEAVAEAHNHTLLCLDELGQIDGREAGEIAYMLANGSGKNRLKKTGELKRKFSWNLLFLSTGETSIADKINDSGKKVQAGMRVRLIDVPADAEKGYGIFDTVHDFQNGHAFAISLKEQVGLFYGTPIRTYLEHLASQKKEVCGLVETSKKVFFERYIVSGMDGQVKRAAERFAIVAAAGELAIQWGILPFEKGEAIQSLGVCFQVWLNDRGSIGAYEVEEGIQQIQAFLETHHLSRFSLVTDSVENRIANHAGYKKEVEDGRYDFYVYPTVFDKEICKGYNAQLVKQNLAERGYLIRDGEGKYAKPIHIHSLKGKKRMIHLTADILAEKDVKK
jgi:putative DNA primase/helicase